MADEKLKTGILTKRGGGFPYKWQDRQFNLHSDRIEYFANGEKKGQCSINSTSTVEKADSEKPRAFRLTTGTEVLLMCSTDDAERDAWMEAIQNAANPPKAAPAAAAKAAAPAAKKAEEKKPEPKKAEPKKADPPKAAPAPAPAAAAASTAGKTQPAESSHEEKETFADQFGLGYKSLMSTQGKVLGDKFPAFVDSFDDASVADDCKLMIASQFKTWASLVPASFREKKIKEHQEKLLALVVKLCCAEDDDYEEQKNYVGRTHWASCIAGGLSTACSMDASQKLATLIAPGSFAAVEKILDSGRALNDKSAFVKECASTCRAETLQSLMRMCPYSGNVKIPNGMDVIARMLTNDETPDSLKRQAQQSISTMSQVNKAAMKTAGPALMEIIAQGDNDNLIMSFASNPEMYTNNPEAIHKHLGYILEMDYIKICSLLYNIAQKAPKALVPHFSTMLEKLEENSQMGAMTLMVIKEIAGVSPNTVYPHIDAILAQAANIPSSSSALAGVVGNCGKATTPKDAADKMFKVLVKGMNECKESAFLATWISEISNIMRGLSDKKLLQAELPNIVKHKKSAEIMVQAIEDFAAGRSLEVVTKRIDDLDAKVNEMNDRVAESCKSYEDVIAYVDKNIADVKDFVGEIVKKLPLPKRLEVVGTVRKTLILHFECVRTGYEFPIQSHEWNKWLKMGFSMAKAGKAVFDIGTGNPLGLVSTGVECVKGIYEAYKSNDDDEFNTYISNPFLTSTEQDGLIEKLRAQQFFDKMSYDSQKGGWYLNDPKKDGTPPGGAAGSVTKVASKKGHGIGESLMAAATDIGGEIAPDMVELAQGASDVADIAREEAAAADPASMGCNCTIM